MDYGNHNEVIAAFEKAMDADHDNRERARESQRFLAARDGQWENEWAERAKDKPRYTFDMVEPIVDQVLGDIAKSDLDTRVLPAGGEASEDIADTFNGLIRTIKAQSNSREIFRRARRNAVIGGYDVVRVIQKYCDGDSFDQDLALEHIPNAIDRVWFGYHTEPDASDASHCWIMTGIPEDDYKTRFPDAPEASVGIDRQSPAFFHKPGLVVIGEVVYLKTEERTLVKMSNGAVYVDDDDFKKIADELKQAGIVEEERRDRPFKAVKSRRFTANGWIDKKPRDTVFKHRLPFVPLYGNFEIVDEKLLYRGIVEKLIDPQRVLNYSLSREIEEGALAPRAKYWMTRKQAEGEGKTLATLNTNTDPVQFYTPDGEAPGVPQQQGGAAINPGLRNISEAMREMIGMAAGMFAANMGDNPGLQSGVAIDALQDRGDRANNKYLDALETFERALCKLLIDAIPEVYTPRRQIRLLSQDGSVEIAAIGMEVTDVQTSKRVILHDVSRGTYEVTVKAAPSFQTRQSETVKAITDIAQADPSIIGIGADILLSNIPTPGMDELAERKRQELLKAGLIPFDQMTREEQQAAQQAAQQPQPESPDMVLARAEQAKADAEAQKAQADFMAEQNKSQQIANDAQFRAQELANDAARLRLDAFKAETEAHLAGLQGRKILADVVKVLAEAEKAEADLDTTVTRIDEALAGGR
jgi:hypothetical protein